MAPRDVGNCSQGMLSSCQHFKDVSSPC